MNAFATTHSSLPPSFTAERFTPREDATISVLPVQTKIEKGQLVITLPLQTPTCFLLFGISSPRGFYAFLGPLSNIFAAGS